MNASTNPVAIDIEIACSLSAAGQAERGREWAELLANALDIVELASGYALKFAGGDSWIAQAVDLIAAERECCPFFAFILAFEPNNGSVWLHILGPDGVKQLIGEQFVPPHLQSSAWGGKLIAPSSICHCILGAE